MGEVSIASPTIQDIRASVDNIGFKIEGVAKALTHFLDNQSSDEPISHEDSAMLEMLAEVLWKKGRELHDPAIGIEKAVA